MSSSIDIKDFADLLKEEDETEEITVESSSNLVDNTLDCNNDNLIVTTLVENTDTMPIKNLSFKELLNELSYSFIKSLQAIKINSVHSSILGFYSQTKFIPTGMKRHKYDFCGQSFYIIKDSIREAMVYEMISKAASTCSGDTFTIPLVKEEKIQVLATPLDTFRGVNKEEYLDIDVYTLSFTPEEIKYMRFTFIRKVDLVYKEDSSDIFKDAKLVFSINKDILAEAPYMRG